MRPFLSTLALVTLITLCTLPAGAVYPTTIGTREKAYVGAAMTLSAGIPLFSVQKHTLMSLDIYNGIE